MNVESTIEEKQKGREKGIGEMDEGTCHKGEGDRRIAMGKAMINPRKEEYFANGKATRKPLFISS